MNYSALCFCWVNCIPFLPLMPAYEPVTAYQPSKMCPEKEDEIKMDSFSFFTRMKSVLLLLPFLILCEVLAMLSSNQVSLSSIPL